MDNKLTKSDIKKILKMTFKYDPETVNTYLQNPQNADEEFVPQMNKTWTGDVWKVAVELSLSKNLDFRIVNIDHGVGILKKQKKYEYKVINELRNKRFDTFIEVYYKKLPIVSSNEAMRFIDS